MAGRLDRDSEAGFPRASHQRGDLVGIAGIGDGRGLLAHGQVPGSPCRVIAVITRDQDGAAAELAEAGVVDVGCGGDAHRERHSVARGLPRPCRALPPPCRGRNPRPAPIPIMRSPTPRFRPNPSRAATLESIDQLGRHTRPNCAHDESGGGGRAARRAAARDGDLGADADRRRVPRRDNGAREERRGWWRDTAASTSSASSAARSATRWRRCWPAARTRSQPLDRGVGVRALRAPRRPGGRDAPEGLAGRRPGIRPHRTTTLPICDVVVKHGLRVTTPARTLLDLAASAPRAELERLTEEAQVQKVASTAELLAMVERGARRPGVRQAPGGARLHR